MSDKRHPSTISIAAPRADGKFYSEDAHQDSIPRSGLTWTRTSDWSLTSDCGCYQVKRQPAYVGHEYLPKCVADPTRVIGEGRYPNSGAARAACQTDFDQQQQFTSNTKG